MHFCIYLFWRKALTRQCLLKTTTAVIKNAQWTMVSNPLGNCNWIMSTSFLFQSILMTIQCVKAPCTTREEFLVLLSVSNARGKISEISNHLSYKKGLPYNKVRAVFSKSTKKIEVKIAKFNMKRLWPQGPQLKFGLSEKHI